MKNYNFDSFKISLGFFSSKNGAVTDKDVLLENNTIGKYSGEIIDGKMEGWGELKLKESSIISLSVEFYEGNFLNGYRHGKGKMLFEDGDEYDGNWSNDKLDGFGKFRDKKTRETYEGEWKQGIRDGIGKSITADGDVYEGQWKNNIRQGKGKFLWETGDIYEGDVQNDKMNGMGKLIINQLNGLVSEGQWENDELKKGIGLKILGDGIFYFGSIKDFKPHGKGKLRHKNSRISEGDWENGELINGTIYKDYGDNMVYEGGWKNSERCGMGKITTSKGSVYEGQFKDDKFNGKGKYTYSDGSVYEGEFADGNFNGKGKLTYINGDVYEGGFNNDVSNGKGKLTYINGDVYDGEWKNGKKNGKGSFFNCTTKTETLAFWSNSESINHKADELTVHKKYSEAIKLWKEYLESLSGDYFVRYEEEIKREIDKIQNGSISIL